MPGTRPNSSSSIPSAAANSLDGRTKQSNAMRAHAGAEGRHLALLLPYRSLMRRKHPPLRPRPAPRPQRPRRPRPPTPLRCTHHQLPRRHRGRRSSPRCALVAADSRLWLRRACAGRLLSAPLARTKLATQSGRLCLAARQGPLQDRKLLRRPERWRRTCVRCERDGFAVAA